MNFQQIKTSRLRLIKLTPEVYKYIHQNYSDEALMDFLALETEEQLSKEKEKYNKGISTYNKSFVIFQMIVNETGINIGRCGFHTWYPDHARAELGYMLFNDAHKGKGLMSEAMKAVIDFGFEEMKLNRIEALVGPANIPSLKLMEKFSFIKEGHLRKHYFKNNVMEDSLVFSLLKEEYNTPSK